ncbi:uncharacterized protein SPAPADRAFT_49125 [Spathaspora passalidarum NRRL Y-27907]|uniref:Altered inheritance of mitochondria protein 39, mitochondrial n=1 Tax=Spathaspora passalidarum (strain NRRL Y-27907 / 11-Y1) TaxID=619300 RepID=G3AJZ4_SPAPN|nr:uncharacterized protein SPAPADRAFT_49125 [Spathaspora passalidarum NRRL Y-27907]EGW34045.1 hypothetical protein SPAPADRAFT_49125 [Spathaspora passalidarum NRRL Y-27907]
MIRRFNYSSRPFRILRSIQPHTCPPILGTSTPIFRKTYFNSPPTQNLTKEEYEKIKYDQLVNESLLNTIQGATGSSNSSSGGSTEQRMKDTRKLPISTVLLLIAAGSSLSMLVYVIVQYRKFEKETNASAGSTITTRSLFLPLWFHTNWFNRKRYQFPQGINYFDQDYHEYILTEMCQLNKSSNDNLENYCSILEQENIKYTVLQKLSSNSKVKQIFGLPLVIESIDISQFKIWVESKYPGVSGIRIDISKQTNEQNNDSSTDVNLSWCIKPINFGSIVNNMLVQLGLKLDRLESSNAEIKTHEKSSGKVHEMKLEKSKLVLNKNRDYDIAFTGKLLVMDKSKTKSWTLIYKGIIDFDHLMINRGVKIVSMDLKSGTSENITYKIL